MFLKNFRVKSNAAVRGSDRRKLRNDILREFSSVTEELAFEIIPNKDDMFVMKILTHSDRNVTAYILNGSPIFFQVETKLYPTVYLLWKYPDMIPVVITWPNVFEKLRGGADLMLPGIIQTNGEQEFHKGQVCSVALRGNRAPVAVGYTALSSNQAEEQGMRGKGVIILHSYLDNLWSQGSKCDIPVIPEMSDHSFASAKDCLENMQTSNVDSGTDDNPTTSLNYDSNTNDNKAEVSSVRSDPGYKCSEPLSDKMKCIDITEKNTAELSSSVKSEELISTQVANDENEVAESACSKERSETTLEGNVMGCNPIDVMDKVLERSFMHALLRVKTNKLPMLTSTFYKNHLLSCCPQGQSLDIKKSSYKKLTKFLQVMENRGFLVIKEQSKGVHCIDSVNWAHDDLKSFKREYSDIISEKQQNDRESTKDGNNKYVPPEIEDVFAVSGSTRSLFQCLGYSKGAILTAKEVRQVVTDYIKSQELVSSESKRMVKLDPQLFSVVHKMGEDNYDSLAWDEVFKRIIDGMNPCHIVTFPGQAPITRKGKLELIEVKLEQRMGNKKVTLVHNLEYYGIDPGKFSHKLQLKAASSTSVSQLPGKSNPGQQVLIQGNQILNVARMLQDEYQIAAKYINGLDKLKQSKNKKK